MNGATAQQPRGIKRWEDIPIRPALKQLLHNEHVTQKKLTALEEWIDLFQKQTLWQRLRWLFRGVR